MERGHAPVVPTPGRLVGRRQRRADHDRVGAARDGLGDVATGAHATVGDHLHVHTGLVEMAHASPGGVGDGGGLRDADAEHAPGGARLPGTDTDENADGAGAHQVESGLV